MDDNFDRLFDEAVSKLNDMPSMSAKDSAFNRAVLQDVITADVNGEGYQVSVDLTLFDECSLKDVLAGLHNAYTAVQDRVLAMFGMAEEDIDELRAGTIDTSLDIVRGDDTE